MIARSQFAGAGRIFARLIALFPFGVLVLGKGRSPTLDANRLLDTIAIHSYLSIISSARTEMDWLINSLAAASRQIGGSTDVP
jgi:hypothetical protein